MKINIKAGTDLTPSFRRYIEEKLGTLAKFIKRFDETGEAEIWLEISRTTRHHRKGDVFVAAVGLRLPRKVLRAEEYAGDARAAINRARDTLRLEIEKYKTRRAAAR